MPQEVAHLDNARLSGIERQLEQLNAQIKEWREDEREQQR